MLLVQFLQPLHVTSYHVKAVKRVFDSFYSQSIKLFLRLPSEQFILSQNLEMAKTRESFSDVSVQQRY